MVLAVYTRQDVTQRKEEKITKLAFGSLSKSCKVALFSFEWPMGCWKQLSLSASDHIKTALEPVHSSKDSSLWPLFKLLFLISL